MQFFTGARAAAEIENLRSQFFCYLLRPMAQRYSARPVQDLVELRNVCRILYRQYRKRNYCKENDECLHFSEHMFLPQSRTLILRDRRRQSIVGTASVFPDSEAGVPSESIYPAEISSLRRAGARFAEVGLLALELDVEGIYSLNSLKKMLPLFVLFKVVMNYALVKDLTHLLIIVHPRHDRLYRFIGFREFAEIKDYPGACDNPALPMMLDLRACIQNVPVGVRRFFLHKLLPLEFFNRQLTESPHAFAELFSDAYSSFNARYCLPSSKSGNWNAATAALPC